MKKHIVLAAILVMSATLPSTAQAWPWSQQTREMDPAKKEQKMEAHAKHIQKKLGLSEEQSKKIDANRVTHHDETKKIMTALKEQRTLLRAEIDKPELDSAKIQSINTQIKSLDNSLCDLRLSSLLAVREILTPEQFKEFQTLTKHGRRH